mmetsp:Transcript_26321/g.37084  ORF Transcript_26321/g.37084 Transcript_26321/m.37084 type:complete len:273 (-) Transcript_26321:171-989(-)
MKVTDVLLLATLIITDISSALSFQATPISPSTLGGGGSRVRRSSCFLSTRKITRNKDDMFVRYRRTIMNMDDTHINFNELELKGEEAAENWGIAVTPFLTSEDANTLQERLDKRADVGYIRVGGSLAAQIIASFDDEDDDEESMISSRTRFVMSNPDLGLDASSVEHEYCIILRIDNVESAVLRGSRPWPHVLTRIGVDIENVGDVVIEDNDTAYLVVAPEVARQCIRLLPKELRGIGISISIVEPGDYLPYEGVLQNMELSKLDKRALQYK